MSSPNVLPVIQPTHLGAVCGSKPSHSVEAYKESIYNLFVEESDRVLAFNSRSSALIKLTPETYTMAKEVLAAPSAPSTSEEYARVREGLIRGQFLIPSSFDEIGWLRVKNNLTRFSNPALSLIIAPTLRCNFSCKYCYVDLNANKMSAQTINNVSNFFGNKLRPNAAASVVFTGGDPSLAIDVVEGLSKRFIAYCKEKNASYVGSLITNGYLLDRKMCDALERSDIHDVQISIDGFGDFHNYTRHTANDKGTYERILENITNACSRIHCHLRINVSALNHCSMFQLIDDFVARGLAGRVFPYFARLDSPNEQSAQFSDKVLSFEDFARLEPQFVQYAVRNGFTLSGKVAHESVGRHCSANSTNSFVIDSNAQLMKCYQDLGHASEKRIGYIDDSGNEVITNPERMVRWLSWDPFTVQMCRDCKVMPVCMGGCSYDVIYSDGVMPPGCITSRFNYSEIVKIYSNAISTGHANRVRCEECRA